jgi:Tfp pilus assembly protein PilF/polyferredoxin
MIRPAARSARSLHLPVLDSPALHRTLPGRPRRFIKWRVGILVAVHILIIAHIVQWRMMGTTIAPLVAAESMYTLEQGQLNNGFLIFAAVILVTLVAGRYLCGWACHMGGLQLFTGWILRKFGFRPRLLRARLLGYVPLIVGLYMFVWPSFTRWILVPAFDHIWPAAATFLRPTRPFPGWSAKLMTTDLWENLPNVAVAIPFLLVCGAATVYFLGARGFCRYGCPYGALLQRVDRLAPGRIIVNRNKCDECGLCTAACGSDVRVLDELKAYGGVVNRLCTRSMDCVDVCPTKALSFGWATPALFKGKPAAAAPRELYDLNWGEEILLIAAFAFAFFTSRGLYGQVPMLMAVGIAVCVAFVVWKAYRVLRDRDSRFGPLQLKLGGRLRPGGAGYLAFAAAVILFSLHSASVQVLNAIGNSAEDRVTIGRDPVFSGDPARIPEDQRAAAIDSLRWYTLAGSWRRGGIGLSDTPKIQVRTAWLNLVAGRLDAAEDSLRCAIATGGVSDAMAADLGRIVLLRGDQTRALQTLEGCFGAHRDFAQVRDLLAGFYVAQGRWDLANDVYERALKSKPSDGWARAMYAQLLMQQGQMPRSLELLNQAAADEPTQPGIRHDLALARYYSGDVDGALSELKAAARLDPNARRQFMELGSQMLAQAGRGAEADRWVKTAP